MLVPQRGLIAIEKSKSKPETAANCIIPELSNFVSPPAEPGVYLEEIKTEKPNALDQGAKIERNKPKLTTPPDIFRGTLLEYQGSEESNAIFR